MPVIVQNLIVFPIETNAVISAHTVTDRSKTGTSALLKSIASPIYPARPICLANCWMATNVSCGRDFAWLGSVMTAFIVLMTPALMSSSQSASETWMPTVVPCADATTSCFDLLWLVMSPAAYTPGTDVRPVPENAAGLLLVESSSTRPSESRLHPSKLTRLLFCSVSGCRKSAVMSTFELVVLMDRPLPVPRGATSKSRPTMISMAVPKIAASTSGLSAGGSSVLVRTTTSVLCLRESEAAVRKSLSLAPKTASFEAGPENSYPWQKRQELTSIPQRPASPKSRGAFR